MFHTAVTAGPDPACDGTDGCDTVGLDVEVQVDAAEYTDKDYKLNY